MRIGRIRDAGTTPWIPPGPPLPAISPAICVPCRSSRVGSSGCARAIAAALGIEHVEPVQQPVADERMREVDAGVEERDGDAAAVEPRDPDFRAAAASGRERGPRSSAAESAAG